MASRRAPALLITVSGQAASLVILIVVCCATHLAVPGTHSLMLAAIGGFETALSLALFYYALSLGPMGLTAALTGLMTALVPVLFSALHYGLPGPVTAVGLVGGCAAIWLITHQPAEGKATPARALLLGALAGIGFGTQLILFKLAQPANVFWIMTITRAAGVTALLLLILLVRPKAPARSFLGLGILAGLLDTSGTLFYLAGVAFGRLDTVAVICSLYPAGTILLAAIVLREHPTRRQLAGMALALGAVALLSL
jgi:drug/metabolite transporter (DMT)-like permease